jgi:predicted DNA-binding transcriptional regulator AlpA
VSTGEIAQMLGVSRQRVDQLSRQVGFPPVWRDLMTGRVWRDTEIEAWAKTRNTSRGRPRKSS